MKAKPRKPPFYQEGDESPREIEEAAASYGIRREAVSVRQAKDRLSELLRRAAKGREIVILSDGRPKAMIVRYRPVVHGRPWVSLRDFRDALPPSPDSTSMIREMRDGGY